MLRFFFLLMAASLIACKGESPTNTSNTKSVTNAVSTDTLLHEGEVNFKNMKQLTFGGDNAEAYFSYDNQQLVFQASNEKWGADCDQIFVMPTTGYQGEKPKLLSTGKGRTTCSFFMPDGKHIVYASTHLGSEACPEVPRSVNGKYVWPIYSDFDIFVADLEGNITKQLTTEPGYDAEPTIAPDGSKMVLRPQTKEAQKSYQDLLAKDVVQPTNMELYICNVDGSNLRQITDLGGANWAPYFHPSGEKIIFSSNHHVKSGRQFNLFMIDRDGKNLKQISFDKSFDAFPMFSPDGKKIVFSSNRNNGGTRDTNVFIADWVE